MSSYPQTRRPCIYLLREPDSGNYKIGRSFQFKDRLVSINTGRSREVEVVDVVYLVGFKSRQRAMEIIERAIHKLLVKHRICREWFDLPNVQTWKDALHEALTKSPFSVGEEPLEVTYKPYTHGLVSRKDILQGLPKNIPIGLLKEIANPHPPLAITPRPKWKEVRWGKS